MNDIYESDIDELTISLLKEKGYSYCNAADGLTPDILKAEKKSTYSAPPSALRGEGLE